MAETILYVYVYGEKFLSNICMNYFLGRNYVSQVTSGPLHSIYRIYFYGSSKFTFLQSLYGTRSFWDILENNYQTIQISFMYTTH